MPNHTLVHSRVPRMSTLLRKPRNLAWLVPRPLAALTLALLMAGPAQARGTADWPARLEAELVKVDAASTATIGVYVRDMDTGISLSHKAQETWYLASMVKVPVALAVLRAIERGEHTLDSVLTLRSTDYVDGTGHTNGYPVGAKLTVRYLLEQMIVFSDNTASDMLIDMVGINEVNALVQARVPDGFQRLTSLADVRRHAYSNITPAAMQLSGLDFLLLKEARNDAGRLTLLGKLVKTPPEKFRMARLNDAYGAYYATELNSARLDSFGELLALLIEGKILDPVHTAYLLDVMKRVQTGQQRIKAGLPSTVVFAHKTGTQRARICDAGLISTPAAAGGKRIIVVACARGDLSMARAERALRDVGAAIRHSGLLSKVGAHESSGEIAPAAGPRAHAGGR